MTAVADSPGEAMRIYDEAKHVLLSEAADASEEGNLPE
jgi:hypothetical protein